MAPLLRNSTFFPQLKWTITFSPGTMTAEICLCIQQTKSATQRAGESHRELRSPGCLNVFEIFSSKYVQETLPKKLSPKDRVKEKVQGIPNR